MPVLENHGPDARIPGLEEQLTVLKIQRRSKYIFRAWKPDLFYYLFALALSVLIAVPGGILQYRVRGFVWLGVSALLLCYVPEAVNWLRYSAQHRPNRRLDQQIESLQEELKRLRGGSERPTQENF